MGGMIVSTLITLYLVPAAFVLLERLRSRRPATAPARNLEPRPASAG
jgi:hypothetical protein